MNYEEIYSLFYTKMTDTNFFAEHTKEEAYELMCLWLHSVVAMPFVKRCFSSISLDDEIMEINYTLKKAETPEMDAYFVKDIFAQGLKIYWMQKELDKKTSIAIVMSGKEEKTILNNYKPNKERLEELRLQLKKAIRDRDYFISGGA